MLIFVKSITSKLRVETKNVYQFNNLIWLSFIDFYFNTIIDSLTYFYIANELIDNYYYKIKVLPLFNRNFPDQLINDQIL